VQARGSSCHGRENARRSSTAAAGASAGGAYCFAPVCFFVVAIVAYRCCNNILGMLQSFVVHVAIVVNMLRPCSLHVVTVPHKCFKIRSNFFYVANINFRCCRC
jgi:hypothetical protein